MICGSVSSDPALAGSIGSTTTGTRLPSGAFSSAAAAASGLSLSTSQPNSRPPPRIVLRNQRTIATCGPDAALDAQRDELADAKRGRMRIGLPQRVAGRRVIDDLAMHQRRRRLGGTVTPLCRPRLYCHTPTSSVHMTTRACDGSRLNCRAGGIAHCRSNRFSSVR